MSDPRAERLERAIDWVRGGGLLAFPTETVWGLGADARSELAVAKLQEWKGRAADVPVSILVSDAGALAALGFEPGAAARALASRFWPGPLTLVMPCQGVFANGVARADGAVGVRCSPHPVAAALAQRLSDGGAGPLTATSLNRSGEPAARTRYEARAVCRDARDPLDAVEGKDAPRLLDPGDDASGEPQSTVVDLCGERPEVLRWGAIDESRLASALEETAA